MAKKQTVEKPVERPPDTGLVKKADEKIVEAKKELALFAVKLGKDPGYALEWGMSAFEAAAELQVWTVVKSLAEKGVPRENLVEHFTALALRGAECPGFSSSATSNLLRTMTTKAFAEAVGSIKWM